LLTKGEAERRRFLQHELETRIGRALVAGDVREGATIRVDVAADALTIAIDSPQPAEVAAQWERVWCEMTCRGA
jgi:ATP-dependent Clp protease ATP-binding subunit ClpB